MRQGVVDNREGENTRKLISSKCKRIVGVPEERNTILDD